MIEMRNVGSNANISYRITNGRKMNVTPQMGGAPLIEAAYSISEDPEHHVKFTDIVNVDGYHLKQCLYNSAFHLAAIHTYRFCAKSQSVRNMMITVYLNDIAKYEWNSRVSETIGNIFHVKLGDNELEYFQRNFEAWFVVYLDCAHDGLLNFATIERVAELDNIDLVPKVAYKGCPRRSIRTRRHE